MANFEIIDDRAEIQLSPQEAMTVCSLLMAQLGNTNVPHHSGGACPEVPLYLLESRMTFISVANKGNEFRNEFRRIDNENTIFCLLDYESTATFITGILGIFRKSYQQFTLPTPFIQGGRSLTLTVTIPKQA
jgi:hypothetical protein